MAGIRIRVFSNDQMVARLSIETNQKSSKTIGKTPYFRNPHLKRSLDSSLVRFNGGANGIRTLDGKVSQNAEITPDQQRSPQKGKIEL